MTASAQEKAPACGSEWRGGENVNSIGDLEGFAASLGVTARSLERIGAKREADAWTFPERDANGETIGTARRLDSGKKLMVKGSLRGLTMGWPLAPYAGLSPDDPIILVEGQSDTATGLNAGFTTIGRPSATGGLEHLRPLLKERHVLIVGENDDDGFVGEDANRVGKTGAEKTADGLAAPGGCASVRIIYPPRGVKDLRAWVADHEADRDEIMAAAEAEPLWTPRAADHPAPPPTFEPFPIGVLPEPAARFVREASAAIGCDTAHVALPLLAALAGCVGMSRRVALKRSWQEPAILWCAVVAPSGQHKTPAMQVVLSPIRRLHGRLLDEHEQAMQLYEQELVEHEKDMKRWKGSKNSEQPKPPVKPIARRVLVSDTTTEALAPILNDNPRGVLLESDELSGWIASFNQYKEGKGSDAGRWLSIHVADSITVDRKKDGTTYIPSPAVSIAGGIQPGTLKRTVRSEHRDNGLLARLLLVMPPVKPKRWTDADVSDATQRALASLYHRLLALDMGHDDRGKPCPIDLPLTPNAQAAFVAFVNEHGQEQAELSDDLAAAWSKLEGAAARLALVVQLAANPDAKAVDAPAVHTGITLARWFGHGAKRVYLMLDENESEGEHRRLIGLIERKGGSVSARELVQASRKFSKVADAEAALQKLIEAGLGQWEQPPQTGRGGPKARRFTVYTKAAPQPVYSVNVYRNPTDDAVSGNTVDVDTVDTSTVNNSVDAPELEPEPTPTDLDAIALDA